MKWDTQKHAHWQKDNEKPQMLLFTHCLLWKWQRKKTVLSHTRFISLVCSMCRRNEWLRQKRQRKKNDFVVDSRNIQPITHNTLVTCYIVAGLSVKLLFSHRQIWIWMQFTEVSSPASLRTNAMNEIQFFLMGLCSVCFHSNSKIQFEKKSRDAYNFPLNPIIHNFSHCLMLFRKTRLNLGFLHMNRFWLYALVQLTK